MVDATSPEVFPITTFSEARRLPETPWAAEGRARSQEEEPGALEKDPVEKHMDVFDRGYRKRKSIGMRRVLASFRDLGWF